MVENAILRGKVPDNDVHISVLEDKVQSLEEIGSSTIGLLGRSHDATSQNFQDKMKEMAKNFKKYSSSLTDAQVPAPKSVCIKVPA